ncbi:hypothetical protein WR25_20164 [Diploscapter pachys]|uniref:Cadherin domain-containing protein n=1 Tax=Diploscapter pachys TaxID=2018661 RepID=A0A2A2LDQ4_9BILA|nr:hypothetical protein WR25_20164 [Diploscapter pachys]
MECWTNLKLAKELNFEKYEQSTSFKSNFSEFRQDFHEITVTAKDGDPHHSNRTNEASQVITVHVVDVQDERPIFETDFRQPILIDPSMKIGDKIIQVKAVDGDKSADKKHGIIYSISKNNFLAINEKTGVVTLRDVLYEGASIQVEITAKEDAPDGMMTSAGLVVEMLKSNRGDIRKLPRVPCGRPDYEFHIDEHGFGEAPLIELKDGVRLPELHIEGSELFSLSPSVTDNAFLLAVLRPESLKQFQKFYIVSPQGRCEVKVYYDEKSNKATESAEKLSFEHDTFLFYAIENHKPTILGKVNISTSTPVNFTIVNNYSLFSISENGTIKSLAPLDREARSQYPLAVRAVSPDGQIAECQGSIFVKDINDNSPVFEQNEYVIEIDEGKRIKFKVTASDPDQGSNGEIEYSIDEPTDSVPIDTSNGVLFLGPLDRDTMEADHFNITVRATDKGTPARSTTAKVKVIVKDINDNWPVFSNSQYSILLDANISPGGVIGLINAEDTDATSPNNYIHYTTNDTRFRVTDDGEIVYAGDRTLSLNSFAKFTVTASDGGNPSHNSTAVVIINEHKARANETGNELRTQIMTNATEQRSEIPWANAGMIGYRYVLMRATAKDYPDSEVSKWVEIDEMTGKIHTKRYIDPRKVKEVKLYISMHKGKREIPVELIINVVDPTVTNSPYFEKGNYKTTIPEGGRPGEQLLEIKALGVENETKLKYTLNITEGPQNHLRIDEKGIVRATKVLDFEAYRRISGTVIAEYNETARATTNFTLILTDINDNRPIFKNNSVFTTVIDESASIGTVLDLPYPLAVDVDKGRHGQLQFSISGGDLNFRINERNSSISLVSKLDFETQRVHSITVRCIDNYGEDPSNEAFASVTIMVKDSNDNAPVIHNSDLMHLTVSEDAAVGTLITVISVTDADDGNKQKVSLDANQTLFRIDDEGKLLVAEKLTGHAGQRFCSTIIATDSGSPPQTRTFPYCVTVYPASNDHHNPLILFPKPNSIHYFDENIEYEELLKITVLEEPTMENISYKLDKTFKKDWELFTINSNGSLKAKAPFDFEKKTVHELRVQACRQSNCSSNHIFVSVNDRNDNCPIFPKQDLRLSVVENEKGRRQVNRIPAALDGDFHSDNTKVCYTVDSPLFFFVDPTIPVLYTNSSFDREHKKQHQIMISAYDCLLSCRDPHKPANGTIMALVDVIDVNDNFPRFTQRVYYATVVQGQATPGSHLTTVIATDPDEEREGLRYSIRGQVKAPKQIYSANNSPISIDPTTGELTANDVLKENSYSFTVSAIDSAKHEDTASISVVTYAQQAELIFDSPFESIVKNEKHIVSLLSNASSLTAIIDRCRQNSNFTLILAHFLDREGHFVDVDTALSLLMNSNTTARRELRHSFGLRDAFAPKPLASSRTPFVLALGACGLAFVLCFAICLWCRERRSYDEKIRQLSVQAAFHHGVTIRPPPTLKKSTYMDLSPPTITAIKTSRGFAPVAHPAALQSTEL